MSLFDVHQHLTIAAIRRKDRHVRVEVSDSAGRQHSIGFDFDDAGDAIGHAETMESWMRDATSLTYVRGPVEGALIDDRLRFQLAFGDDAPTY